MVRQIPPAKAGGLLLVSTVLGIGFTDCNITEDTSVFTGHSDNVPVQSHRGWAS